MGEVLVIVLGPIWGTSVSMTPGSVSGLTDRTELPMALPRFPRLAEL